MVILAQRIKEAREAAGLTQEELGESVGVTMQTVYRWEAGTVFPRIQQVEKMAELFNRPCYWFFYPYEAQQEQPKKQDDATLGTIRDKLSELLQFVDEQRKKTNG